MYDAALKGDVPSLLNLLDEDPLILDRCNIQNSGRFMQSPLHVAANLGHINFIIEILCRKPALVEDLDHYSKGPSPLHLASVKGHLEVVRHLLAVKPNLCFSRDQDGRNPIHVAAMCGQVHVLDVLLQAYSQAAWERTNNGDSVLHLCIKHRQPEALKFLSTFLDDHQLINSKDSDGNTILHLVVIAKQPEIVTFLLKATSIEVNAINTNDFTAIDTHIRSKMDLRDEDILQSLKHFKVLQSKNMLKSRRITSDQDWLEKKRNTLMVVASLIATMAFQVGINPPGGTWQDDQNNRNACFSSKMTMANGNNNLDHVAGSIMAIKTRGLYNTLLVSNTIGLISSLSVILLLISGLPFKKLLVGILMITMWIAVSATIMTYLFSICFLSLYIHGSGRDRTTWVTWKVMFISWALLMAILLLGHGIRFIAKLIRDRCSQG
ncbi:ankyrin repeat-containing protein BDA1-like [Chenopodium quinoa]|uniref:PGG domain-containing protein n=1 Tax=Chenopodium quinoa TaxID=63459 RepID=A0A803MA49_CHEQI|nr:ankyrin repeat-containing protein BDA1-like [Chenopodium quinoa]